MQEEKQGFVFLFFPVQNLVISMELSSINTFCALKASLNTEQFITWGNICGFVATRWHWGCKNRAVLSGVASIGAWADNVLVNTAISAICVCNKLSMQ